MCSMQPEIMLFFFFFCETFMSLPHGIELQLFSAIGTLTVKPVEKKLLLTYCALGRACTGASANCF